VVAGQLGAFKDQAQVGGKDGRRISLVLQVLPLSRGRAAGAQARVCLFRLCFSLRRGLEIDLLMIVLTFGILVIASSWRATTRLARLVGRTADAPVENCHGARHLVIRLPQGEALRSVQNFVQHFVSPHRGEVVEEDCAVRL
jgi:hypothetical protein